MNDLFLFMEKCRLCNYADDNSLEALSDDLWEALFHLICDGRNAINWFKKDNPDR